MIVSLVLKDTYNIGLNSNNKFKIDDHLITVNEVPFLRYRFAEYGDKQIEYIKSNMKNFTKSVHLVEIQLDDKAETNLERLGNSDISEKIARFLYIPVNDSDIANGLSDETLGLIEKVKDYYVDRVMIKDNSSMMYELAADRIKIKIEEAFDKEVEYRDIGVCGSPLSFRNSDIEGQACLTAVWARKIMANYIESDDDIPVPTASHECMTCCGCIKYLIVEQDLPAPLSPKEKSANKEKTPKEPKQPKEKAEKPAQKKVEKPKGIAVFRL